MNYKIKQLGQVITPDWLVQEILNASEYMGEHILCRYALEPACGDGQFLGEMVKRYIQAGKTAKLTNTQIASQLSQYIVGIEIDPTMYQTCIKRLNQLAQTSLGMSVDWQIYQKNTLDIYKNYPAYFDWIVGNPPYVRLHHLDNNIRQILKSKFEFTHGTTDLYLAFFEMAFFMLNKTGKLAFITPNSFLYNTSYQKFRDYLAQQKKISALCNLKANKVFDGFSTYTAISVFDNAWQKDYFTYKEFVNGKFKIINQIYFNQLTAKKWGFSDPKNSEFLARINSHQNKLEGYFNIQYGFATLRDKIFIGKYTKQKNALGLFNGMIIEEAILRPIIKASRYKGLSDDTEYVLFPYYDNKGRYVAYTETDLAQQFPHAYAYLLHHKDELLKRDIDKKAQWFEFGRSQGIQTCHQEKIVISTLVNQKIHYFKLPKEVLVYSGIFLTKKSDDVDWQIAENALSSQDFLHYVRLTGKDMSGGYKSLSSKQIKAFPLPIMNNQQFLDVLKHTYIAFLNTNSRSNAKLKILHGAIADDLSQRLNNTYQIKSLGYGSCAEHKIQGRYINKTVDITILKDDKPIAGIGVKFVMQNYAQNANNYFENMLGETANIRSNQIPYFQIFIIPNQLPYYKNNGDFSKWEKFNNAHFNKYALLSFDNTEHWVHTPNKTLLYTIDLPPMTLPSNKTEHDNHYLTLQNQGDFYINTSCIFDNPVGANIIINDYESFIQKVAYRILSQ